MCFYKSLKCLVMQKKMESQREELDLQDLYQNENMMVYCDFNSKMNVVQIEEFVSTRIQELSSQGFTKKEIITIIFDCQSFRNNFIEQQLYEHLKKTSYDKYLKFHLTKRA
jgi:hypothetical protein